MLALVEIIPVLQTSSETLNTTKSIIDKWGKVSVLAKDTPGFIVNRVARPFYGESLRIYEEGIIEFHYYYRLGAKRNWRIPNGTI